MESSGHYWLSLASHLGRRDLPVAVVNPLAAKYFARSRLARTKSDPADARSLAEMGCGISHEFAIRSRASSCARPPGSR